jgi:D-alanine-D-alanine ligase
MIAPSDVAVLMGGWSAERQVSLWSGEAVVAALRNSGLNPQAIDITAPGELLTLPARGVRRVINVLHGEGGEDGRVQALLDLAGIAYPGCGVLASALAMDKLQTKRIWQALGLPTAPWRVAASATDLRAAAAEWCYPLFVKPSADGSSVGISRVTGDAEVDAAWRSARSGTGVVMVEPAVPGAEYTCSVLDGQPLPLVRIEPDGTFYDFNAKYVSNNTRYHCPAGVSAARETEVQALCAKAFAALGGEGFGRVDFLMTDDGEPSLLEVNTLPGMTSHSLMPLAAQAVGMDMSTLVCRLLALARPRLSHGLVGGSS